MELYKSYQDFSDAIIATADYFKISPAIVEKDYFVTIVLKKLKERIPGILFKGGTSLSKCFKVINRFSEDIDLTLDTTHFTQSNKRNANKAIISVCDELGFEIENRDDVEKHSHGSYNCYYIKYPISFSDLAVKPYIKLEMVFIQKAYPDTIKPTSSMIGDYLSAIGQQQILPEFELEPYDITVQTLERTFVDKVFALCDYYIRKEKDRQSRHIYDIGKLMKVFDWRQCATLIEDVRNDRCRNKTCVSAQPGISISDTLNQIIEEEYFRKDYEEVTSALIIDKISYDDAIQALVKIAKERLFDTET